MWTLLVSDPLFSTDNTGREENTITFISCSSLFSPKDIKAALNFGILGVEICLWNSGTSVAFVNMYRSSLIAALRVGVGSFFL